MGVLDTVLRYKQQKDAEATADISAIPQAAMLYQQAKQQQFENQIKSLTAQAQIARAGYKIGPNGQLVMDESLASSKPVFTIDDQGNLVQSGSVAKNAVVKQLPQSVNQIAEKAKASREATTENPQLDQDTQKAIAALDFLKPRLDNANKILDKIGKDEFEKLSTQIQIGANNELIVPNGSPLEDLVAELNDAKVTGFSIAGAAYTDTEKATVEGGFNPIGKSFDRFKRDIIRNQDFFTSKARAGTMGLKEARAKVAEGSTYSAGESKGKTVGKFKIVAVQ